MVSRYSRLAAALAAAVLLIVAADVGRFFWYAPAQPVLVTIGHGSGCQRIAAILAEADVVSNRWYVCPYALVTGAARELQAGTYRFDGNDGIATVIARLRAGDVLTGTFRFADGAVWADIKAAFAELSLAGALHDDVNGVDEATVASRIDLTFPSFEGAFLPDTYQYRYGDDASALLATAHRAMTAFLADNGDYDTVIIASMIEKEGVADGPLIAAVINNRLRRGMRLQIDATRLYNAQTHNTYRFVGLPPTAIALPSKAALRAALQPATHDFLYYVADGSGRHYFSRTLREHNLARQRLMEQQQ